jgi:SAM-dependent methyltransferase
MSTDQITSELAASPGHFRVPEELTLLNKWMFSAIQPYIRGRILEIGSGNGELSDFFVQQGIHLHLSDENDDHCIKLREKFQGVNAIRKVHNINFLRQDFRAFYASKSEVFSTLIALNVADHNVYDKVALANSKHLLRQRGFLIFVAPAYTALYPGTPENTQDLRRFNQKRLKALLDDDFEILKTRYFNLSGNMQNRLSNHLGLSVLALARKL